MWTDTHCHLYSDEFSDDLEGVLRRANATGVTNILLPNIDSGSLEQLMAICGRFTHCFPMIGLHPCSVKEDFKHELELLAMQLGKHQWVGIGEIGIDLYWDKSTLNWQIEAFQQQCVWAFDRNIPVAIHSREATGLLIELLSAMSNRPKGVFHCFTGSSDEASLITDMGYYLGIGGVLTFKNSTLREVLKTVDPTKIILETDAPYLAPVPHRGKRNEPAYVPIIGEVLSQVIGLGLADTAALTTANARALFGF
jgi:TatD DNase family protein